MYRKFIKRLIDFMLALISLIIISPVFIIVAIILFISNDGKPFFFQERPGKGAKIFKVIKFKTMNDRKDEQGRLLSDAQRMTKIGRMVRGTSLDEIPQLINVLKGDMSLIGPRPLLVKYLPLYSPEQARRHDVRPGISGWAQVNGRNAISWEDKFKYDVFYVDHLSLAMDLKIIMMTIKKVFKREGVNEASGVTMTAFKGNK